MDPGLERGDFIFALTMGTEGDITPITLGIYKYIGNENTSWSSIMAAAVLSSIESGILISFSAGALRRSE